MVVDARNETGAEAERALANSGIVSRELLVPGTVVHVSDVKTPYDEYSLFRWEQKDETAVNGTDLVCSGAASSAGGWTGCGTEDITEPSVGHGSTESSDELSFNVSVSGLDEGAAWAIVETESGYRVASAIVDGTAYLEWPGGGAAVATPTKVRVLDTEMNEIWSSPIDS
jgi:hypothetical protein